MTARISIFDIPLLLDTICVHFTTRDSLLPCLLVCPHWHDCFLPQFHRFVELDSHKDDVRIGYILELSQVRRLRSLDVDIVDVGYFVHSEGCVSLETLRCGNYENVSLAKRLAKRLTKDVGELREELGLALGVVIVETEAEFRRLPIPEDAFNNGMIYPDAAADSTTVNVNHTVENEDDDGGAHRSDIDSDDDDTTPCLPFSQLNVSTPFKMITALIARNPHLCILEIINDRRERDSLDVVPDMAPLIPKLVHLTTLKVQATSGLHEAFLANILWFLSESVQDVEIKASELFSSPQFFRPSKYQRIVPKPPSVGSV